MHVDRLWLDEITGGDSQVLAQLVDLLAAQVQVLDGDVKCLHAEGRALHLAEQAHLMKGSTASLGLRMIADRLGALERLAREGDAQVLERCCLEVLSMLSDAMNELKSLL